MTDFVLKIGRFTFKPTIIPSVVTAVLLSLLLTLGFWQLNRANQKEALQTAFTTQLNSPYTPIAQVDLDSNASRYRGITVKGRYQGAQQILLDNQVQDGQPGYHVYTPLRIADSERAILINRGWVPLGLSRQKLPDVTIANRVMTVRGRLSQPANPGILLDTPESANTWPRIVQHVDYTKIANALGYPLAQSIILLDSDVEGGYLRDWRPIAEGFGPERHRGYAAQWFSLAVALIAIYIVVNTRSHREPDAQPE